MKTSRTLTCSPLFRITMVCLLVSSLLHLPCSVTGAIASVEDETEEKLQEALLVIKKGIDLYLESDFNNAIQELNSGLAILEQSINQLKAGKELINAHLHLGLAYLGVNNVDEAKSQFKEVVRLDPKYSLDAGSYSGKVIALFNEAKAEYLSSMIEKDTLTPPPTSPTTPAAPPEEEEQTKKPFYKKWWFWTAAGIGIVGIAAAAAANKEEEKEDPQDNLLFSDNFNDGNNDGWVETSGSGNWRVQNGELAHIAWDSPSGDRDRIETGDASWRIGELQIRIGDFRGNPDDYEAFIYFGFRSEDNTAYITFNYSMLCLHHIVNGEEVFVESIEFPLEQGRFYNVIIEITSTQIIINIDGDRVMSHPMIIPLIGRIALGATSVTPIKFDDIKVYSFESSQQGSSEGRQILLQSRQEQRQTLSPISPARRPGL